MNGNTMYFVDISGNNIYICARHQKPRAWIEADEASCNVTDFVNRNMHRNMQSWAVNVV